MSQMKSCQQPRLILPGNDTEAVLFEQTAPFGRLGAPADVAHEQPAVVAEDARAFGDRLGGFAGKRQRTLGHDRVEGAVRKRQSFGAPLAQIEALAPPPAGPQERRGRIDARGAQAVAPHEVLHRETVAAAHVEHARAAGQRGQAQGAVGAARDRPAGGSRR